MAMPGSLGEKIGEGAFAEVHAWAPGQVVKLFKSGVPPRIVWWETRMTRAVHAAGGPAPEVLDEVTLDGRSGIVLPRLDGPTLQQCMQSGGVTFAQGGAILARLALAVHRTPAPPDALPLRDTIEEPLQLLGDRLPQHIAAGIRALVARLPPGEGLCHGDLRPDNVIMTGDGPALIDWLGAVRAPAAFDLAYCAVALTEVAAESADDPERPRAVNAAAQSAYAQAAGLSPAALAAAIEPYLPVARVWALFGVLFGVAAPAVRERLIQRVAASLRLAD